MLPKPISAHFIEEVFHHLRDWWTFGFGRQLPAWKSFCLEEIDLIAADDETLAVCVFYITYIYICYYYIWCIYTYIYIMVYT